MVIGRLAGIQFRFLNWCKCPTWPEYGGRMWMSARDWKRMNLALGNVANLQSRNPSGISTQREKRSDLKLRFTPNVKNNLIGFWNKNIQSWGPVCLAKPLIWENTQLGTILHTVPETWGWIYRVCSCGNKKPGDKLDPKVQQYCSSKVATQYPEMHINGRCLLQTP